MKLCVMELNKREIHFAKNIIICYGQDRNTLHTRKEKLHLFWSQFQLPYMILYLIKYVKLCRFSFSAFLYEKLDSFLDMLQLIRVSAVRIDVVSGHGKYHRTSYGFTGTDE